MMNYYNFNKDKYNFNNILIIINRLNKQIITIFYYKTTILKDITKLYLYYIYYYYNPYLITLLGYISSKRYTEREYLL